MHTRTRGAVILFRALQSLQSPHCIVLVATQVFEPPSDATSMRSLPGQIDSFGLTNVFVVVVRYFGGTKLGTSGLINAYRNATIDAFQNATIIEKTVEDIYQITFDYALMSNVMNAVKKQELEIVAQSFSDEAYLRVAIAQSSVDETLRILRSLIAKIRIEEIDDYGAIEGLKLAYLETR